MDAALCVVMRSGREILRFENSGRGSFDSLAWERRYLVTVSAAGYPIHRAWLRLDELSASQPVSFHLARGAHITGQALDRNGEGVAGAAVWFLEMPRSGEAAAPSVGAENQVATGLRGKFVSPWLRPGRYQLLVTHSQYGQVKQAVELTSEHDLELGTVVVETP